MRYVIAAVLLTSCAHHTPAPVAASQPASMVTMTRAEFDALAIAVVRHNGGELLALNTCNEKLAISKDQTKAADARADQLKLATIFGSVGAAALASAVALLVHFWPTPSAPKAATDSVRTDRFAGPPILAW